MVSKRYAAGAFAAMAMIALMMLAPAAAVADGTAEKTVSISISDTEVESEQSFTVSVNVVDNPGFWALRLFLDIPDCVSVVGVASGQILGVSWSENPGESRITLYGENRDLADVTSTGVYATISLKAVKTVTDISGGIVCAYSDCVDINDRTPDVDVSGGSISVKGSVPVHVHEWKDSGKGTEATCEQVGERILVCTGCSEEKHETVPAKGHVWGEYRTVKGPTEAEEGLEERSCGICGKTEQKAIPKTVCTHDWKDSGKGTEATCEQAGERILVCTKCSEEKHETVPAKGHSWGPYTVVKQPTGTEDGLEKRTCGVCGETEQRTIPKKEASADYTMIIIGASAAIIVCALAAYLISKRKSRI